jgi:glycosyltransferase involved in cell wall biosynthesis
MHINIVKYESDKNVKDGILTKFANKMYEELTKLGMSSKISDSPDPNAHINHHIHYTHYKTGGGGVNTLMVTHFLDGQYQKIDILKDALKTADMGICFSEHGMARFIANGVPKERLTYILPAHDGMKRRPRVVAILTSIYGDGRKRESMITELFKVIDKEKFQFRIMGSGWQDIIDELVLKGYNNITYFENFDRNLSNTILDSSDYLLYTGEDEGAISVLEAANAGVKTIATLQGYHYEICIDYPFSTQDDLNKIFKKLEENKVEGWTWEKYTKEHLKLWQTLSKKSQKG